MKYFLLILLSAFLLPLMVLGQTSPSQDQNYVRQINYQTALNQSDVEDLENTAINNDKKIENIIYYDGLGRPKQRVAIRAGGNREDLLTPIDYDALGRQPKDWLPYPELGNNGQFITNVHTPLLGYYYNQFPESLHNYNNNPYSEKRFEDSPVNRVLEQGAPGEDWRINPDADTDHTIKFGYEFNSGSEVWNFSVVYPSGTDGPHLQLNSTYSVNTLTRTVTKDENWQPADQNAGIAIEFQNKQGQTLLKRQTAKDTNNQSYNIDTYYVYDDYGNLVYVLSPEGTAAIVSNGALVAGHTTILDKLCYQYVYDNRNRLVEKKIPGKGWEHIVYDQQDRPVLTQDANMRSSDPRVPSQWLFTRYDELGRVAYTGIWKVFGGSRQWCQNIFNTGSGFQVTRTATPTTIGDTELYYSSNGYPISPLEVLTVNYYDDYVDYNVGGSNGLSLPTTVYGQKTTEDVAVETTTKGLPTVSRVRVLGQSPVKWVTTLTAYDSRGRAIYWDTYNEYLGSRDKALSKLEPISGRASETQTTHIKNGITVTLVDYFTYDPMGRLLSQQQQISGSPAQLIAKNHYDALGQLVRKDVGGETTVDGYTDVQNIDVTFDGIVTPTSSATGWQSRLKTRGKIMEDGGISFKVAGTNKLTRVGLVKPTSGNTSNEYLDYGIFLKFLNNAYKVYIVKNGTNQSTTRTYASGDTFKVERSGAQIKYYHNNSVTPFTSVPYVGNGEALTGKVAFSGPGGGLSQVLLYGPNIDKVLQNISYRYNIRGWLTDINNIDPSGLADGIPDLFNFRINYNKVEGSAVNAPLYNGNISQTLWKTKSSNRNVRGYAYSYDPLNRITGAESYQGTNLNTMVFNTEYALGDISYDKNGNILSLARWGADDNTSPSFGQWDDLTYTYDGNKLMKVVDDAASNTHMAFGFKDGVNSGDDYRYDHNGNMNWDSNKGITSIVYNHLNLPTEIVFGMGQNNKIEYVYDATGNKLSKSVRELSRPLQITEYAGGFIYNNAGASQMQLQFFSQPEGYVKPVMNTSESVSGFDTGTGTGTQSSYSYVFQYRDIWGNERLSYSDLDLNGAIDPSSEILSEKNYYPYGLTHKGYNNTVISTENNYKQYQGQEYTEDLGLNTHEWKYRVSDPATGRFWQIDPLAEKYTYNSTYAFQENKMGMGVELEGLEMAKFDTPMHDPNLRGLSSTEMATVRGHQIDAFVKGVPLVAAIMSPIPGDEVFVGGLLFKTGVAAVDAASQMASTGEVDLVSVAMNLSPMGPLTKEATDALIDVNVGADGISIETGFGSTDGSAKSGTSVLMDFVIGTAANKLQSSVPSEITNTPVGNIITEAVSTGVENVGGNAVKTQIEEDIQNN